MPLLKRRKSGEGVEYTSCRLCRRAYKSINFSHLVRKHHFDPEHPVEEYKAKFRLRVATSFESCELRRRLRVDWLERQGRHLSRKEVLRLLRAERAARRSLLPTLVLRRFHSLHHSGVRIFGSWRAALRAAGLQPDLPNRARVWSREKVLARIRSLPATVPLNRIRNHDPRLCEAALRYLGGWRTAVEEAGRVYPVAGGPWKWTRERILREIQDRARRGASIRRSHVATDLPGLVESACLLFEDWRSTVRAAGLERRLPQPERHWTRQELFELLRTVREERETVTYAVLAKIKRPGFISPVNSVQRHFGTLSRARTAAGLPAREWRSRVWTRSGVQAELRSRIKKGLPLGIGIVQERAGGLVTAAKRHFGDWRSAVRAAGGVHLLKPPMKRWTQEAIVQEIRGLVQAGHSIDQKVVRKARPGFVHTVTRHFGSWARAVGAAGCRSRLPVAPRHWTRKELVQLLRGYWRRTGRLSSKAIKGHKRSGFLGPMYSVTKVFGSFPAAKRAAGLGHVPSYPIREWTPKAVVEALRDRARRGLPMNYSALERDCYSLLRALYARFGSITTAFRVARLKHATFQGHRQAKRRA